MAKLLYGAPVADALIQEATEIIRQTPALPVLAIVRAGDRPDDLSYERAILKGAEKAGISVKVFSYNEPLSECTLLAKIKSLNQDQNIHGVLIFRPLPEQIDERKIMESLLPQKDVDGITSSSLAGAFINEAFGFVPCTAGACMEILRHYDIELSGKKVTVLGRSLTAGRPVALMAMAQHATVTVCHSKTLEQDLLTACREANILISAIGKGNFIQERHICPDQIIIDAGINLDQNGNLCGDVDSLAASKLPVLITPVPGGVGTVTTALLIKHIAQAARRQINA